MTNDERWVEMMRSMEAELARLAQEALDLRNEYLRTTDEQSEELRTGILFKRINLEMKTRPLRVQYNDMVKSSIDGLDALIWRLSYDKR